MPPTVVRSILMAVILGTASLQAWGASPFAREIPTTYPKFGKAANNLSLVVAELVATDYLKGDECPTSRTNADGSTTVTICMDPPPTWFKARVLQHVAGEDIGDEFYAVTGSHYGAMKVGAAEPAQLMLLNSNGTALEMMRYKSWPVIRGRDGHYYLIVQGGHLHSLPCSVAPLMQEIDQKDFSADLAIDREDYNSRWAKRHAAFYRVTTDSVHPRYAIPVARLQQSFNDAPLAAADFSCRDPNIVR